MARYHVLVELKIDADSVEEAKQKAIERIKQEDFDEIAAFSKTDMLYLKTIVTLFEDALECGGGEGQKS